MWVVYPDDRVIDMWTLVLADDESKHVRSYKSSDTLDGGDVLPEFTMQVSDVFPDEQD